MVVVSALEYLRNTYMYAYVHLYIDKLNLSINAFDISLYSDYYGLSESRVEQIENNCVRTGGILWYVYHKYIIMLASKYWPHNIISDKV